MRQEELHQLSTGGVATTNHNTLEDQAWQQVFLDKCRHPAISLAENPAPYRPAS
jgi:hypothetical protein